MNQPLIEIIEKTRIKTVGAVNQIIQESGLPAYLMEGILVGIVSDIRNQKNAEIIQAMQQREEAIKEEKEASEKQKNDENTFGDKRMVTKGEYYGD